MSKGQQSKTVFISYRRDVSEWEALLIARHLRANDYDVFFDQDSIDNGEFGQYIINEIKARDHFLILLEDHTLDRCNDPSDWVRLEIETALDLGRNVVPIIINDFDLQLAAKNKLFPDKLEKLLKINACELRSALYFDFSMETLQKRYLKLPVETIPVSEVEQKLADQEIEGRKPSEFKDTIVLWGEPEDVEEQFKKRKRWYPVSIGAQRRELIDRKIIKYVAIYEAGEINAIRYYAQIDKVDTWNKQEGQQAIWLTGDIESLHRYVRRNPNRREMSLNRPRTVSLEKIKRSATLDELFDK